MLLYNPYYLFDVGFQLSYSAVLSIVVLQPQIEKLLAVKHFILKPIWSLITVSVAAQIGTFPLTSYYFHQFPNYFLLTNLLIIPATYIILTSAILSFFTQLIFNNSLFFETILKFNLKFMNNSVRFIEQLPYSSTQDIYLYPIDIVFLFCLILFLYRFTANHKHIFFIGILNSIIALQITQIIKITGS
jgi:competence protein ComEC